MNNKIAIVTGASRGVGKDVALYLAKTGYFVVLIARNNELLSKLNAEINAIGGQAAYYALDVSQASLVQNCIEDVVSKYGKIDLLINNAAILKRGTTELADDQIAELLNINLHGAIYMAKYVAQQMKQQRSGYIINITSLGAKVAASFSGIYAASKFGLAGFNESLTKEMSLYDVKVTNIFPSMIATEMAAGRKFKLEQMIQLEDITKTVAYLLSLSTNALPTEILIGCLPLIATTTELMQQMYLGFRPR